MSIRSLAVVALLVLGAGAALAQPVSRSVSGIVIDAETRGPLPGAAVSVPRLARGVATDADGHIHLRGLPADTLTLRVSYVGFEPDVRLVDLREGDAQIQVALAPSSALVGEVEVVAEADPLTRDARAVSVLDGAELEAARGQTLAETLGRLPGVTALTTGPTIAKPVVRGLHSDRLLLVDNGVRQEGQQWGGEHAPEIDPFAPQRVEVIRGAAGVEYGAGAIGGVIRLDEAPLPSRPGVSGRVSLDTYTNSLQGATSATVEGASARWPGVAWRAQGSFRRAGDARTPDFVIRNSAFREASGRLTLGLDRGPLDLDVHLSRYDTELGIYRGSHFGNARNLAEIIERGGPDPTWDYRFSYAIDAPKQAVTHDVASVHGTYGFASGDVVEVRTGVQRNHRREFDAHRPFSDSLAALGTRPSFDLSLWTTTLDASFAHRPLGRFVGKAGVSGMLQQNANGESGYLIPNFTAGTVGAWAHETWLATDALSLEAGTRLDLRTQKAWPYDRRARAFDPQTRTWLGLSGVFGAIWRFDPTWSLSTSVGTAWRPPGINQLYAEGVHHGSARFELGDDTLVPERSLDVSATLRHQSPRAHAEVSVYANTIRDYVYLLEAPEPTVTIRGTFPTFNTVQNDARLAGIDADVELRPTPWLTLGATGSLLRADNLDLGGPLYGVPSDRGGARLRLQPARLAGLTAPYAEVEVTHVTRQDRLQPGAYEPAPAPDAYTLTSLNLGTELRWGAHPVQLSLSLRNAFDVAYRDYLSRFRYFIDDPGRDLVVRLRVPL